MIASFLAVSHAGRVLAALVGLGILSAAHGHAQTGLTLKGDSVTGLPDGAVTVRFRTEGFWQITSGMGTIQWDPQVVDYVSAGDFGIPALSGASFTRIPEGMLAFTWTSGNLLGNTLADGTVLFSLTFAVRGVPDDATSVAFTNGWTPLHFESAENINLPFSSVSGGIAVVPEPASAGALLAAALSGFVLLRALRGTRPRHFAARVSRPRGVCARLP